MTVPHVVVVGAGFAGLDAVRRLVKQGCQVTLIDKRPYTTFQPLLYQVATGGLNPGDVTYSLRSLSAKYKKQVRFRRATVLNIDYDKKEVITSIGDPVPYDYVILSVGVEPGFFGVPGTDELANTTYTRPDSLITRDLVFTGLEGITTDPDHDLSIVVVGGGATGVEMAGALAEMKILGIPSAYPELDPSRFNVHLIEGTSDLLGPFAPKLRDYAHLALVKQGVQVHLGSNVDRIEHDQVVLKNDKVIPAHIVIWCAGVSGHKEVADWGVPQGRGGRIEIDEFCRVRGLDNVYAIGDCAINPDNPLPQLAQPAKQMGKYVPKHILAVDAGQTIEPFSYVDLGTMATISRNAAVVEVGKLQLTGFVAWLAWVVLHLALLLGGRNRLQAMINLGVRYIVYPHNAQSIVGEVSDQPRWRRYLRRRVQGKGVTDPQEELDPNRVQGVQLSEGSKEIKEA